MYSVSFQKKIAGKLLHEKDQLTGAIIDCLNALGLESDVRSEVQDRVLSKVISGGTSLKEYPVLITVSTNNNFYNNAQL